MEELPQNQEPVDNDVGTPSPLNELITPSPGNNAQQQTAVPSTPRRQLMKRGVLIAISIVLIMAVIGTAMVIKRDKTTSTNQASSQEYHGKIRIGAVVWPGFLGLYIADKQGYFKDAGLDVEVKNDDSLSKLDQDYTAGKFLGRANPSIEALQESQKGFKHKIIFAIDYSTGADGIIAGKNIKDLSELRNQKVAFEKGTMEEIFLKYALNEYGMTLSDIVPVDLDGEKAAKAFTDSQVPAAVTYEPFISQAVTESGGRVVYSSKDATGLIADVFTMPTSFINQYPATVTKLINAYFKGVNYWRDNASAGNVITAKALNDTPSNIAEQLNGITMLGIRQNQTAYTYASGLESLYGNISQLALLSSDDKSIQSKVKPEDIIEPRFIHNINE